MAALFRHRDHPRNLQRAGHGDDLDLGPEGLQGGGGPGQQRIRQFGIEARFDDQYFQQLIP